MDYSIPVEEDFDLSFCFLAKDVGSGEESQRRWHYDSEMGICQKFDYKGKKGNGNRFLTRQVSEGRFNGSFSSVSFSSSYSKFDCSSPLGMAFSAKPFFSFSLTKFNESLLLSTSRNVCRRQRERVEGEA